MVQRKAPSKLGIQADQPDRPEKRVGSLKPSISSSHQNQDGRNRRNNLMKKMKKSRSKKFSDIESLILSPLKVNISQPGKPPTPPDVLPASLETPQKQSVIRTSTGSPNYMKSTSSSEARKERGQVSPRRNLFGSEGKNHVERSSKYFKNDSSGHNPIKSSTKSSSLKLKRTLTKTPSFKPARSSVRKCSKVALCADINAQRATCSSTLKDSKFPTYLVLGPGGTESKGTSVMKVCPYTYCSLNGHWHAPLPPLKSFLSARRLMLKTQKSMKWDALSPRRVKRSADGLKDNPNKQGIFTENPSTEEQDDSSNSAISNGDNLDFFIEIYAKDKEDTAEPTANGINHKDDENILQFSQKMEEFGDYEVLEQESGQVAESVSDGSPHSEIDFQDHLDENNDNNFTIMAMAGNFYEEQNEQSDESFSESSDMEWEEGLFPTLHPADEAVDKSQFDNEADLSDKSLSEIENDNLYNESIIKSDDVGRNCFDKILSLDGLDGAYEEESQSFEDELDGMYPYSEGYWSSQESDSQIFDQLPSFEDELGVPKTVQENPGTAATDTNIVFASESVEELVEETMARSEATIPTCDVGSEIITTKAENAEDDTHCTPDTAIQALINEDNSFESHRMIQDDTNNEASVQRQGYVDERLPLETQGQASKEQFHLYNAVSEENDSEKGCGKAENSMNFEEPSDSNLNRSSLAENRDAEIDKTGEHETQSDASETCFNADSVPSSETGNSSFSTRFNVDQALTETCNHLKGAIRCKKPTNETEDQREFNPREPNFLPVEPDPEAEKVDLRHQMMDERKNADEWMIDYALQRTVTKLAPAQKRRVALLVQAFETVVPIPKRVTHDKHTSAAFAHVRSIQACS